MSKNAPPGDNHKELERIRKERIKVAIKDAAKDPLFLADIREIEKDFEYVDFEEAEK